MKNKNEEFSKIIPIAIEDNNKSGFELNRKKLILIIIGIVIFLIFSIIFVLYSNVTKFRVFCDYTIFHKRINEENLNYIQVDNINSSNVFGFMNYIEVVSDNKVTQYNNVGKVVKEINVEISNPLVSVGERCYAISEVNGQKLYCVSNEDIIWKKELDGKISRIKVNQQGYVAVIISGTSYKSVVILYDEKGNEIFKTYLSSTIAVDVDISQDCKYLGIAEVDISGTAIQSNIKVISIELAKNKPNEAIIYEHNAKSGSLITGIKYQNKSKLLCMYDDSICVLENEKEDVLEDINDKDFNAKFVGIDLNGYLYKTGERAEGLFSNDSIIELINVSNNKKNIYECTGSIKKIVNCEDKMGIVTDTEICFINTSGWLIKKFSVKDNVKGIVLGRTIAGIIYKDRIELLNI